MRRRGISLETSICTCKAVMSRCRKRAPERRFGRFVCQSRQVTCLCRLSDLEGDNCPGRGTKYQEALRCKQALDVCWSEACQYHLFHIVHSKVPSRMKAFLDFWMLMPLPCKTLATSNLLLYFHVPQRCFSDQGSTYERRERRFLPLDVGGSR